MMYCSRIIKGSCLCLVLIAAIIGIPLDHGSYCKLRSNCTTQSFRVAVFDGPIVTVDNATTKQEALAAILPNLGVIRSLVSTAKNQGAFLIVLPEYGITGWIGGRENQRISIYPYLEELPNVARGSRVCGICRGGTNERIIQNRIACLAKQYRIYIVANLMESVSCRSQSGSNCPPDNHYQYNTNIVFDSNGCLVAKYRKYNLFAEEFDRLDSPSQPEHAYFDTKYGRFGTIICQDAIFKEPGVVLIEDFNVSHILFPTAWGDTNSFVYMQSIDWFSAFARRFGVNFLASNINQYEYDYTGSGIFNGDGVVKYVHNAKNNKGTLVLADIAADGRPTCHNRKPYQGAEVLVNKTALDVVIYNDTYRAVFISQQPGPGSESVCYNGFCCQFDFIRNNREENYILAAFDGYHSFEGNYHLQSCVVYKCSSSQVSSCTTRQTESKTTFTAFSLHANFSTEYVFPIVTPHMMKYENVHWDFYFARNGSNILFGSSDWPVIALNLIGRLYDKDSRVIV